MSKNLNPDEVCARLISYIASRGLGLSRADQAEIRARVLGHSDAATQTRHERQAGVFFVMEIEFDDIDHEGAVTLQQTLTRLPLQESTDRELAYTLAQQEAALRGRAVALCDANFENVEVIDETPVPNHEGVYVYQALGALHDITSPRLDSSLADDFTWDTKHPTVRQAVGGAKALMNRLCREVAPDELNQHLVLVVDETPKIGKVLWRIHR